MTRKGLRMKKAGWIICLCAALIFVSPAQAQNVIEALPGEDLSGTPTPPPGAEDAPAAEVDKSWMTYNDPYLQAQKVISSPHRTPDEVAEWLKALAVDLMTHSPEGIIEKVQGYRYAFSDKGYNEFVTYMRDSKVLDMVNLRRNQLSTIASGDVAFVGSGPIGGVFTWSASLPLLISFYQLDADGNHRPVAGGSFMLESRISRSTEEKAPDGMVIDGWRLVRIGTR